MKTLLKRTIINFLRKNLNRRSILGILAIVVLGVANTIYYSFNYYTQNGLKKNILNTISINWNSLFIFIIIIILVIGMIKIFLMQVEMDGFKKASEESEDENVKMHRNTQDLIIRKFELLKMADTNEKK